MTGSPSLSNRLAHRIVEVTGAAVAPTNRTGRGFTKYPDSDTDFVWTGAPVLEFRKHLYKSSSKRRLSNATTDHAVINAFWSGDFAVDGVVFRLPGTGTKVYVDGDDRNGAAETFAQHGVGTTDADGYHERTNGRGQWTDLGFSIEGLDKCELGPGVEIYGTGHVVCPWSMTPDDVRVVPAHPAIIAAVRAALEAKRQHKRPVAPAPATPGATLPADRAKAYALAVLAHAADELARAATGGRYDVIAEQSRRVGAVLHLGLTHQDAFDVLAGACRGYRHYEADKRKIDAGLRFGARVPYTPRMGTQDVQDAFRRASEALAAAIDRLPASGRLEYADGATCTQHTVNRVLGGMAEMMRRNGIYGVCFIPIRDIQNAAGLTSIETARRGACAAVRAGYARRVPRSRFKWLAKFTDISKRREATAYELDPLAILRMGTIGTGMSEEWGGGHPDGATPDAGRGVGATGSGERRAGIPPSLTSISVPIVPIVRMLAAGLPAGEIAIVKAVAGGARSRAEILAACGVSRRTACRYMASLTRCGVLVWAGGQCDVAHDVLVQRLDELMSSDAAVLKRSELARRIEIERDVFKADVDLLDAIEQAGGTPTNADRLARRDNESRFRQGHREQHGVLPGRAEVQQFREDYKAVVVAAVRAGQQRVDDGGTFSTPTDAPTFETGTVTGRDMAMSTPTHTRQTRAAAVSAPLTLARRAYQRPRRPVLTMGAGGVAHAAVAVVQTLTKLQRVTFA